MLPLLLPPPEPLPEQLPHAHKPVDSVHLCLYVLYLSLVQGVKEEDAPKVEALILDTLAQLEKEGFTQTAVEAAVNTIEFSLRCAAGSVGGCHVAAVVCVYLLYLRLLGTWSACCYVIGEPPPRLASSLH